MMNGRPPAVSALLYLVSAVFAIVVLDAYGWYRLFNAAIPMIGGIFWLGVFALAAWGAGNVVAGRWVTSGSTSFEGLYLQMLAGTTALAATAGLLAFLHLLLPAFVVGTFGLWACWGGVSLYRRHRIGSLSFHGIPLPWCVVLLLAGGVSLAAATTLAPFYDQWHYHLGFPYQWLREGTTVTFPRQAYSFFPANMGLLYTYALAGPGGWGAQVIHWWMGALAAAGSATIAGRLGAAVGGRFFAAAAFAVTPAVVQMGALAGSDLGVAAYAAGSMLLVLRMIQTPGHPTALVMCAGLAAGLSAGCKYSALATVVLPMGIVTVVAIAFVGSSVGRVRRVILVGMIFGLGAGIATAPWLIRNMAETGNPVHPYLADVFVGGEEISTDDGDHVTSGIGTFSLDSSKMMTALTMGTFSRRGRAGDLGPVHLMFMPLILWWAWRHRKKTEAWVVIGFIALGTMAWAAGPPLGRYFFPILAVNAGLIGASWSDGYGSWSRPTRGVLTTVLFMILAANCNPARDQNLFNQVRCFLGAGDSDDYLATNLTQIEPFRAVDAVLPLDAKVLLVGEPRPFQIDRDVVVEDQFRVPLLVELANQSTTAEEIADSLREMGVTHIVWNAAEAARIAKAEHRDGFLICDGEPSKARLDRFLEEFTSSVESGEWWAIMELSRR